MCRGEAQRVQVRRVDGRRVGGSCSLGRLRGAYGQDQEDAMSIFCVLLIIVAAVWLVAWANTNSPGWHKRIVDRIRTSLKR